jgi:hypothetical protein
MNNIILYTILLIIVMYVSMSNTELFANSRRRPAATAPAATPPAATAPVATAPAATAPAATAPAATAPIPTLQLGRSTVYPDTATAPAASATTVQTIPVDLNARNKARYIVVGNHNRPDLAIGAWSLIEIEAYDNKGENVIKNKEAKIVMGEKLADGYEANLSNNGIVFTSPTDADLKITDMFNSEGKMVDNIQRGYHGKDALLKHALKYDLGAEYYIDQIVLHNRWWEGSWNKVSVTARMNGTTIELYDANNNRLRTIQTGNWHNIYSKEYLL